MSAPEISCPAGPDNDGAFALHWRGSATAWRLEENGTVRYTGSDTATTMTGRNAGMYEYRVAAVDHGTETWSAPCRVEVAPPTLGIALALAAIGAAVFGATLYLVWSGDRAARRDRGTP